MANTYQISSRTRDKVHTVTLGPRTEACTCEHFCYRQTECAHIRLARAEQYRGYELTAGSLEDAELARLIAKYRQQPGPVLLALLADQFDREQLQQMPAPPPVFPALDAVLVRARHWGREQREVKLKAVFA